MISESTYRDPQTNLPEGVLNEHYKVKGIGKDL